MTDEARAPVRSVETVVPPNGPVVLDEKLASLPEAELATLLSQTPPDFVAAEKRVTLVRFAPATIVQLMIAALGVLLFLFAVTQLGHLILVFLVGVTMALSLLPGVHRLMRRGLKRGVATGLVYLALLLAVGLFLYFVIAPLIEEISAMRVGAPEVLVRAYERLPAEVQEQLAPFLTSASTDGAGSSAAASALAGALENVDTGAILSGFLGVLGSLTSAFFTVFLMAVISFYWIMAEDRPQRLLLTILDPRYRDYAASVLGEIAIRVGAYVRGELLLGLIVGVLTYLGLSIIGVPFVLLLSVLAGLMEMVPTIGSFIAEVPAVIIGYAAGGLEMAFWVFILYTVIQNVEGWVIVPRVMGQVVDLPGLVVLLAVIIWGTMFGLLGALLAVPMTAALGALFKRLLLPYLQQRVAARRMAGAG